MILHYFIMSLIIYLSVILYYFIMIFNFTINSIMILHYFIMSLFMILNSFKKIICYLIMSFLM